MDVNAIKARLSAENADLLRQTDDSTSQLDQLSRLRSTMNAQLEEQKRYSDDQIRVRRIDLKLSKSQ
jgi:phospholipase/lecithinase/hemolysin